MRYFLDMTDGGPFAIQMTSLLTDEQLMVQVARGEAAAFRQLAGRHLNRAYAIALRLLHNREDAEEVSQEAISRVWQKAVGFDSARSAFGTWFYRIVTNAALDRLRRRKVPAENLDDHAERLSDTGPTGEDLRIQADEARRIKQAISILPVTQQMALTLVYYEDFPQAEAARIMNITTGALESLLFRAKKTLKQSLKPTS
ncbi:MAG: sigma-70 family RNA polymerase sigma factor [Asticcacaulis sp.]|uniref:sigma-70 family RNA polymerase sigma factor n=1 Tax=Asticcacaulis sp. TaxID=1872648 RepID=UPI0039E4D7A8